MKPASAGSPSPRATCQTAVMAKDGDAAPGTFEPSEAAFVHDPACPVLPHGRRLSAGMAVEPHDHPRGQLLWAMRGVLRVFAEDSVWIVPPSHAVWIPGGVRHHMMTETQAELRNLYVDASRPLRLDPEGRPRCSVLLLTPLMRELILRLDTRAAAKPFDAAFRRLSEVALDEIDRLAEAPLSLPGGRDPRLVRLTQYLGDRPGDTQPLAALARLVGASPRTLERLFRNETGLTFRQWRGRNRLLNAVEQLHLGRSSTEIAWSLGYSSPSAFIAAFRATFGRTPQGFARITQHGAPE